MIGICFLLCYALIVAQNRCPSTGQTRVMIGLRLHLTGGHDQKTFSEKIFFGRIAHKPYGGKTGRAMIKYPLYKKNNSRKNTLLYPGLTTVSFDCIINLCHTTMY